MIFVLDEWLPPRERDRTRLIDPLGGALFLTKNWLFGHLF